MTAALIAAQTIGDVQFAIGPVQSLLLSQAIVFLPSVLFLLGSRTAPGRLIACGRPALVTSLLVVAFTYLCMPAIIAVNAISMLFVENEVVSLQTSLQGVSPWLMLLVIGVIGPANEEFVFRGVIYHGYRRSGRILGAVLLSALLFGLTHLNFNQMSYAVLVGVIGALLIEGTGSIFYSFLFHAVINCTNVVEMLLMDSGIASMSQQQREAYIEAQMQMPYKQALCISVSVYLVIAGVTIALAACLFYAILKREGRTACFAEIFSGKAHVPGEKKQRLVTPVLVLSVLLCLLYMTADILMK